MKKLLIMLALIAGISLGAEAQDEGKSKKEQKKEEKAAKKAARKQAQADAVLKSNALIQSRQWVLEATTLQGKGGSSVFNLDPNLNFVIVEGEKGTIQLGLNGLAGWNGVGGVTLEGDVTSYEIRKGKKDGDPVMLNARFSGPGINVTMRLSVAGEFGDVLITGTFSNDRLTFRGKLVHPNESTIFKGRRSN